jgi:tetratricopeptide (TPR) repeat protein
MGHETEIDAERLKLLEERMDPFKSPVAELLGVVSLYLEPFHRYDSAAALLEKILAREPRNGFAEVLLAYCCINGFMDRASLNRAVGLTQSVIEHNDKYSGAALILLAEALDDLKEITLVGYANLLLDSIKLEPSWVFNHFDLAGCYRRQGQNAQALTELNLARNNIWLAPPDMSPDVAFFESMITGRASDAAILERLSSVILNG